MQHKARKRFGQNFLTDDHVIDRIVQSISIQANDQLVEIGPGQGALTREILPLVKKLEVIELDRDLITGLEILKSSYPSLNIHNADALRFDFSTLTNNSQPLRVIGNLPYNISTPLIFNLLSYAGVIKDMHFMLQKEVVERMAAEPGSGQTGRLTIMVQYRCKVEKLFIVPPEAFDPRPKVESAIVRLTPYTELPFVAKNEKEMASLVTEAFSQRRKTLRNCLKKLLDAEQIESIGIDPKRRPETLTVEEFVNLANLLPD